MGAYLLLHKILTPLASILKPVKKSQYEVLLTGNFYSDNWIRAQLQPLALSNKTKRIRMVAETEVPTIPKVEPIYPPNWLNKLVGSDLARLLTFTWLALTTESDIVGGFHLLVNGLLAILLGRMTRARSLYVCGGGAWEVEGGGYASENRVFGKLGQPDKYIEKQLHKAVSYADIVVARGQSTLDYFLVNGKSSRLHIVPAGIDGKRFRPSGSDFQYDIALVGRLSEVKRVDLLLEAVADLKRSRPNVKAAVIGDGPLLQPLKIQAKALDLHGNVSFLGHRDDIDTLLPTCRTFVLTSDSEGLSQAMIQAMLCGVPAVVSDVGDLSELVENGTNGYLIKDRTYTAFSEAIKSIFQLSAEEYDEMRKMARGSALRCDITHVSKTWDHILESDFS
jgi:glycosyltransferase involved in cell wall biosynthesis